jgi:hypothetical protein
LAVHRDGAREGIKRMHLFLQPYSNAAIFRDINHLTTTGIIGMNSESVAGVLGAIIASIVLVIAIAYGPIGQFGKPTKPAPKVEQPGTAAPGVRGPVVREVPQ